MTLGLPGFASRPVHPDDPLVCVCGATIATQRLTEHEDVLLSVRAAHAKECAERLAHQQRHRGPVTDCPSCPPKPSTPAPSDGTVVP